MLLPITSVSYINKTPCNGHGVSLRAIVFTLLSVYIFTNFLQSLHYKNYNCTCFNADKLKLCSTIRYNSVISFCYNGFPSLGNHIMLGFWKVSRHCIKAVKNDLLYVRINRHFSVSICLTPLLHHYFLLEAIFFFLFADPTLF